MDASMAPKPSYVDTKLAKVKVELEVMQEKGKISEIKEHLSGVDQKMVALKKLIGSYDSFGKEGMTNTIKQLKEEIITIKKAIKLESKLTASKALRNKSFFLKKVNSGEQPQVRLDKLKADLGTTNEKINNILHQIMGSNQGFSTKNKINSFTKNFIGQYKNVSSSLLELQKGLKIGDLVKPEIGITEKKIKDAEGIENHIKELNGKKGQIDKAMEKVQNLKKENPSFAKDPAILNVLTELKNKNNWIKHEMQKCKNIMVSGEPVLLSPKADLTLSEKNSFKFNNAYQELVATETTFQTNMQMTLTFLEKFSKGKFLKKKDADVIDSGINFLKKMVSNSGSMLEELKGQEGQDKNLGEKINSVARSFASNKIVALAEPIGSWINMMDEFIAVTDSINKVLKSDEKALGLFQETIGKSNLDLGSLFIQPVQRGPRFSLLGSEMRNACSESQELKTPIEIVSNHMGILNSYNNLGKAFDGAKHLYL